MWGRTAPDHGDDGYDLTYIPQQMLNYAHNRGKANDQYYTAGLATIFGWLANHVISALDAAPGQTSNYNKRGYLFYWAMHFQDIGGGENSVGDGVNGESKLVELSTKDTKETRKVKLHKIGQ